MLAIRGQTQRPGQAAIVRTVAASIIMEEEELAA